MACQTSLVLFETKQRMKNLFKEEANFKEFKETMDRKLKSQSSYRKESGNKGSEVVFQCIKEVSET